MTEEFDPEEFNQDSASGAGQGDSADGLMRVFHDQLRACLEECARGRPGLFSDVDLIGGGINSPWPEAVRLRELAMALQSVFAQDDRQDPLCDEFLDLCTMHGESHPGESRLARLFLARIDNSARDGNTQSSRGAFDV
jgi:hypothetical protein